MIRFQRQKISINLNIKNIIIPEITKIVANLNQSNNVGIDLNNYSSDNISTTLLKANINILAPILSNLINKSFTMMFYPKSLKRAKILRIYKNKDKPDLTYYRSISILLVISKVYENVFLSKTE